MSGEKEEAARLQRLLDEGRIRISTDNEETTTKVEDKTIIAFMATYNYSDGTSTIFIKKDGLDVYLKRDKPSLWVYFRSALLHESIHVRQGLDKSISNREREAYLYQVAYLKRILKELSPNTAREVEGYIRELEKLAKG